MKSFCFGSGVFCLWCRHTWEILSLSDYFVRFVLFPTRLSLSCPKLFFSISGDFLGIFKGALGGLQGLVCSQIIKEHNLARGQNLEERWQNGTTTKWYFFTFRVFPFLALHCQLVVHCSEVDRREEKG